MYNEKYCESPTRITNNKISSINVLKINNLNFENKTENLDLGYLYHLAQILHINIDKPKTGVIIVRKRKFIVKSIEEFKYLLHNRLREYIFFMQ
jgi:hypothetical protein